MPLIFANPAGFWALLAIPAVLLIHFLQRPSRIVPSSTLFLLDAIDRISVKGRTIERLRQSVPLWLQLLMVLLLTWLLVEPRWNSERTVQQVVVVLDSSASMSAFREQAKTKLREDLTRLTPGGIEALYTLLESHDQGSRLYRGTSIFELVEALEGWQPSHGEHPPEAALRVGRSLAGSGGTLVYLSDHLVETLPYGASLLSVGETLENVGFAGQFVEESDGAATWQATVRNYGTETQTREWFLASGSQRSPGRTLSLAPGETRTLSGEFPGGSGRITLVLEGDRFPLDDRLHLLVPQPKPLTVAHRAAPGAMELIAAIISSLDHVSLPNGDSPADAGQIADPDLLFATYNPLRPEPLPPTAVGIIHQGSALQEFFRGPIVAANHPLMDHLNWQGLIARQTPGFPVGESDTTLLWQGDRPLVLLRETGDTRQLLFNFDVQQSNAARLPAFIVLVNRFVETVRRDKVAPRAENAELRQRIPLAFETGEGAAPLSLTSGGTREAVPLARAALLRAPAEPGFFEISQGDIRLFTGSANFADTREADFSRAASYADLVHLTEEIVERQTVDDPWWQVWLLALVLLALTCWGFLSRESIETRRSEPLKTD